MTAMAAGLLRNMDIQALETQAALRCAPLIAGIKTACLLIIKKEQAADAQKLFGGTHLAYFALCSTDRKIILLICRRRELEGYLARQPVRELLSEAGYEDAVLEKLLCVFGDRYAACLAGRGSFPHEMGLFLGYPPEDVRGFIRQNGRNFLFAGCWKVYGHPQEKQRLFRCFEMAEEGLLKLLSQGFCLKELLKYA